MTLLELRGVSKTFHSLGRPPIRALDEVDLGVEPGMITGLVGESGSGKSTVVRCIVGLERPDQGEITYDGVDLRTARKRDRRIRREIQLVFQDPTASLNPRMTAEELLGEGLKVHRLQHSKAGIRKRVGELMELVGLDPRD